MEDHHVKITHWRPHPTKEAIALKEALEERGLVVYEEKWDGYKHVDLELPDIRLYIEVDGIHHLIDPHQILRDLGRGYYSHKSGYNTMHIPNDMLRKHLNHIADALSGAIKIRKGERINVNVG
jgi:very-short-patch-repair endonuclease